MKKKYTPEDALTLFDRRRAVIASSQLPAAGKRSIDS